MVRFYTVLPRLEVDMDSSAEEFVRASRNHQAFRL